jgi:hypothetical protein
VSGTSPASAKVRSNAGMNSEPGDVASWPEAAFGNARCLVANGGISDVRGTVRKCRSLHVGAPPRDRRQGYSGPLGRGIYSEIGDPVGVAPAQHLSGNVAVPH